MRAMSARRIRCYGSVALAFVLLSAPTVRAGGDSNDVRIASFVRDSDASATFTLDGGAKDVVHGCRSITIVARDGVWTWRWGKPVVTKSEHRHALDRLAAEATKGLTRFGFMGSGVEDDPAGRECW